MSARVVCDMTVSGHCVNRRAGLYMRDVQLVGDGTRIDLCLPASTPTPFCPQGRYRVTIERVDNPCECGAESPPDGLDDSHHVTCKDALRAEVRKLIREEMKK